MPETTFEYTGKERHVESKYDTSVKETPLVVRSVLMTRATSLALAWVFLAPIARSQEDDCIRAVLPRVFQTRVAKTRELSTIRSASNIKVNSAGVDVTILYDTKRPFDPARFAVQAHGAHPTEITASYSILPQYFDKAVEMDVDGDGLQDLVLISNLVGLMGNTADLFLMSAFLLRPDSTVAYLEFSSYKGDDDLFKDYNGDGKLEFACVKKFVTDRGKFYTMNLFSFVGGRPRNVSVNVKPFPIFFREINGKCKPIKSLPRFLQKEALFPTPIVWRRH